MSTVQISNGEPAGRIICSECGNATDFVEVADNVIITTHFVQNRDGSFTKAETESHAIGEIRLFCGQCDTDMTQLHAHLREMIF